jgi:hypothetical protein
VRSSPIGVCWCCCWWWWCCCCHACVLPCCSCLHPHPCAHPATVPPRPTRRRRQRPLCSLCVATARPPGASWPSGRPKQNGAFKDLGSRWVVAVPRGTEGGLVQWRGTSEVHRPQFRQRAVASAHPQVDPDRSPPSPPAPPPHPPTPTPHPKARMECEWQSSMTHRLMFLEKAS